jgi:hypothetical protein
MPDKIEIDEFSLVEADDKLYLFLPAQKNDCEDARLLYNKHNVMLLQRDNSVLVLKDIPQGVRPKLAEQKEITVVEIAGDNQTIVRGYEVEMIINPDIPNEDKLSDNFDKDFAFLKDILSADDYQKFKSDAGF